MAVRSKLLVSKPKTKKLTKTKNNALRNPKGCKSGQSKPKGSKRYIVFYIRAHLLPAATIIKSYTARHVLAVFYTRRAQYMKRTVRVIAIAGLSLLTLLGTTQPAKLPSVILIVPFILMFAILALTIALLVAWRHENMTVKAIRFGCMAALLPILLLVLQSVGQLTLRDGLTLVALFVITYFYMSKVNAVVRT